ncbi:MAG: peptidylprolyl isomerase [Candidatus Altiarchaeales archaeon HGW-Altiarchaeales-3]|nr:MAG: peptidylprolyl isomerase [Candidatus Altiarchaeales archaeon HGW-Altiarchaeales-3]
MAKKTTEEPSNEVRFIKISYTARLKEDGRVFETTDEETAKKENIYNKQVIYRPIPIVVGGGHVVKGVDEALEKSNVGDKQDIEVPPEKGFGMRDPALVRLVSRKTFTQQKVNPVPGMIVTLDEKSARVQTVTGGRVRVDLNSELAGKTLVYGVNVEEEAKDKQSKINYLIERSFNSSDNFKINQDKSNDTGSVKITIPEEAFKDKNLLIRKATLSAEIFRFIGADKITYEEVWKK